MTHAYPDEDQPANRCTHCPRLLHANEHGRYACYICEDRAREQLLALPGLYDQLGDVLQPGSSTNDVRITSSPTAAPLPVALQPLDLRGPGGIATQLRAVEDAWRHALGWTVSTFSGTAEQTLTVVIPFLTNNLPWACDKYDEVADDLDTIGRLHARARNTATGNQARLIRVVCRYLYDDGTECGAKLPVDINRAAARCQTCGTRWGRDEWMGLYEATRPLAA